MPTNPANQCDVNIDQKFIKYGDDKSIVVGDSLGDGENDRIILMSRPEVMQAASRVDRIAADATFKSAPGIFFQVFIIFGLVAGSFWAPMFYGLMPHRGEESYRRLYGLIHDAMTAEGLQFQTNLDAMFDFEIGNTICHFKGSWKK